MVDRSSIQEVRSVSIAFIMLDSVAAITGRQTQMSTMFYQVMVGGKKVLSLWRAQLDYMVLEEMNLAILQYW